MNESLIKDNKRVQQHGEVFTPDWIIEKMLAIPEITEKLKNIDATFLEPSCGEGNFLVAILEKKLSYISCPKNSWENKALRTLASIYAIELLSDNVITSRWRMADVMLENYKQVYQKEAGERTDFYKSVLCILNANIVHGNTLTRKTASGEEIIFSQWKIMDEKKDTVKRIPFIYSSLFKDEPTMDEYYHSPAVQLDLFLDEENTTKKEYKIVPFKKVFEEELVYEDSNTDN